MVHTICLITPPPLSSAQLDNFMCGMRENKKLRNHLNNIPYEGKCGTHLTLRNQESKLQNSIQKKTQQYKNGFAIGKIWAQRTAAKKTKTKNKKLKNEERNEERERR